MAVKYVFVTGGVVSGLGKGITAASLGRLLKARGYTVTMQKFDPYINIDPGTMNPVQLMTELRQILILVIMSVLSMKVSVKIPTLRLVKSTGPYFKKKDAEISVEELYRLFLILLTK